MIYKKNKSNKYTKSIQFYGKKKYTCKIVGKTERRMKE